MRRHVATAMGDYIGVYVSQTPLTIVQNGRTDLLV